MTAPLALRPALDPAGIERTARRFALAASPAAGGSRFAERSAYYYVRSKLRGDPASRAVSALAPLGDVVDIGCGRGHLAVFLLEHGLARSVRGFDWDSAKVALANRAAEGLEAAFDTRDVRAPPPDGADRLTGDTVLLVDVLHYVAGDAQDELLRAAADMVRPGGRLVVREATTGRGWRSAVTLLVERISRLVRFNVGERIALRDVEADYVPVLEGKGLACTVEPCWDGTPFSNVLLVARRP
jgi:SAM-dependent methyltransferase